MIAGFVLIFVTCTHGDCVADYPVTEDIYRTRGQCDVMQKRLTPLYSDKIECGEVHRADPKKVAGVLPAS